MEEEYDTRKAVQLAVVTALGGFLFGYDPAVINGAVTGLQDEFNFVISQSFPTLADIGLVFAYGRYAAFALISFLFVLRFVQKTKGRQLEDMV